MFDPSHRPRRPRARARAAAGFTLIELMVAVAIVGVIAGVAYPQYTDYVKRSRLAEATGVLTTTRVRLEQFYQDNRNYGSSSAACGVVLPAAQFFSVTCNWGTGATNQSFVITASGLSAAGMSGYTFTVDHNNAQRTTSFPGAAGLPVSCWLRRKGDTC